MILDTSFIIDLLRNNKAAIEKAKVIEQSEIIMTTTISIFELCQGIETKKEHEKMEKFVQGLISLELGMREAKIAGQISRELRTRGKMINSTDCLIAGIALSHHETVLTRDVSHFSKIPNLKVETY